jgi:hypothetical protein
LAPQKLSGVIGSHLGAGKVRPPSSPPLFPFGGGMWIVEEKKGGDMKGKR